MDNGIPWIMDHAMVHGPMAKDHGQWTIFWKNRPEGETLTASAEAITGGTQLQHLAMVVQDFKIDDDCKDERRECGGEGREGGTRRGRV